MLSIGILLLFSYCMIISCKGYVLSAEKYKTLKGEDFCTTKLESPIYKNLCVYFGKIYEYDRYNYREEYLGNYCHKKDLHLYSEKGGGEVEVQENLLHCEYHRDAKDNLGDPYISQFAKIALGRGENLHDVMEYEFKDRVPYPIPFKNHPNLLKKIEDKILDTTLNSKL